MKPSESPCTASAARAILPVLFGATSLFALPALALPAISVQGALRSAAGLPVADGAYLLGVRLYANKDAAKHLWNEDTQVKVVAGLFAVTLGEASNKPPEPALFAQNPDMWLGVQVQAEGELPRVPLGAVPYSYVAQAALDLQCSGCVGSEDLAANAVTSDKVAFAYAASSAKGGAATDVACVGCVGVEDIEGAVLAPYAKTEALPAVAQSGSYKELKNLPVLAKLGASCGTGLYLRGLNADGSHECVAGKDNGFVDIESAQTLSGAKTMTSTLKLVPAVGPALVADGNVGVGFAAPGGLGDGSTYKMLEVHQVAAGGTNGGLIGLTSANLTDGTVGGAVVFGTRGTTNADKRLAIAVAFNDGDNSATGVPKGRLALYTSDGKSANNPRLTITSDGKVGIGTTSPGTQLEVAGSVRAENINRAVWSTNKAGSYDLRKIFDDARTAGMVPGVYDCVLRTDNGAHWTGRRFTAALNFYIGNGSYAHKFHGVLDVQAGPGGCSAGLTAFDAGGTFSFDPGNCSQTIGLVCNRLF